MAVLRFPAVETIQTRCVLPDDGNAPPLAFAGKSLAPLFPDVEFCQTLAIQIAPWWDDIPRIVAPRARRQAGVSVFRSVGPTLRKCGNFLASLHSSMRAMLFISAGVDRGRCELCVSTSAAKRAI